MIWPEFQGDVSGLLAELDGDESGCISLLEWKRFLQYLRTEQGELKFCDFVIHLKKRLLSQKKGRHPPPPLSRYPTIDALSNKRDYFRLSVIIIHTGLASTNPVQQRRIPEQGLDHQRHQEETHLNPHGASLFLSL